MLSRRSMLLGVLGGTLVPDFAHAKKPKETSLKADIRGQVSTLMEEKLRPEYLPLPTRLPKLGESQTEIVSIDLEFPKGDMQGLFLAARDFFTRKYEISPYMAHERMLAKKYPLYEIIPYIVAPKSILSGGEMTQEIQILFLARRKNPKATGSSDWLQEWVGPVESELDVDIVGTAPKAKTKEEIIKSKSLGAGTNFQIFNHRVPERDGQEYVVLATRYPQYGEKDANIQTPFSEGLATPEVIEQGKKYFEGLQTRVTTLLAQASWAETLKDIEWYKIIQGLILTENMNPAPSGLTGEEEVIHYERELRKVHSLLGANREYAFRRSSGKGAKGIVQFTQAAWDGRGEAWDIKNNKGKRTGMKHNFLLPGFTVNPDFHTLISDHVLSVLAACAHVTSQYQEYRTSKLASSFESVANPVKHLLLSAGYNSNNTGRVQDFTRAHQNGEGGIMAILDRFYKTLSNSGADETRGYMRKFLFALKSLGYSVPETSFFRLHGYNPRE